jgi:hypothetical protein
MNGNTIHKARPPQRPGAIVEGQPTYIGPRSSRPDPLPTLYPAPEIFGSCENEEDDS